MKSIRFFSLAGFAVVSAGFAETVWAGNGNLPGAGMTNFHKFFVAGGWLVWLILLPLSVLTVSLIIQSFLGIRRNRLMPSDLLAKISDPSSKSSFAALPGVCDDDDSMLGRVLAELRQAAPSGADAMELALHDSLDQETTLLMRKIEWLHIIGNVAPMIGLFGTVWGMIDAFNAIVQAGGQPTLGHLAGGISVVLVATWWGLVSAIPALAAFGILRNRVETIAAEIASRLEPLISLGKTGSK